MNCLNVRDRKFVQFQVWKNCRIGCNFCYNIGFDRISEEKKKENLQEIDLILDDKIIDCYNEIGFIGGELFNEELQDREVRKTFYSLFYKIAKKIKKRKINKLYIATSLLFDFEVYFRDFLFFLNDLGILNETLVCTSYDEEYRFKNIKQLELWKNNVEKVFNITNKMTHVEIILTKAIIQKILSGSFNIRNFCSRNNVEIDFIEPSFIENDISKNKTILRIPNFYPTRREFIKFINKVCIKDEDIGLERMLAIQLRPDLLIYKNFNDKWIFEDRRWERNIRRTDKYGIKHNPSPYADSDKEMIDDLNMIKGMM